MLLQLPARWHHTSYLELGLDDLSVDPHASLAKLKANGLIILCSKSNNQ